MQTSFIDKEAYCQFLFDQEGPYWHIATPGNFTQIIFTCADDFRYGMSQLGIGTANCGIKTFAFQVMTNHLHSISSARSSQQCLDLLEYLAGRLKRYSSAKGRPLDLSKFVCEPLPITSLQSLRNNIVYTHRNKYVVDSSQTPFSYAWGSGILYFGLDIESIKSVKYNELSTREQRLLTNSRTIQLPDNYTVRDGCITPESFCDWKTGRSFFRDAHQYFNMLTKNYEAYAEFAALLGDSASLTDEEMYSAACSLASKKYGINNPAMVSDNDKQEIARTLYFQHHAGKNQIRRILRMDQTTLDSMFPTAK